MRPERGIRPPRDAVELLLYRIWCDRLNVDTIALDENFFDVGGTSLAAMRVLADVNIEFDLELSIDVIFTAYTIDRMARVIRKGYKKPPKSLVVIRRGTQLPALACIHPIGGNVIWFRDLAAALPTGVPCVGFQAMGLDPRCNPHRDIPSMAAHYIVELKGRYDPRDVVLTGYSFGGLVCFEMACQLEIAGTPPRGVVLLDTIVPDQPYRRPSPAVPLRVLVEDALGLDLDVEELTYLPPDELRERLLVAAIKTGALPAGYGHERLQRLIEIYPINFEAAGGYRLPTYGQRVHLVRPAGPKTKGDSTTIWRARCPAALELHDVGGDHNHLISGRHASAVARVLRDQWWSK
jgi:thioesterase domain-containing protein/acyl carrier protein